jgi:hypothetical protein
VPAVRLDDASEWIRQRAPARPLAPTDVDAVVEALMAESQSESRTSLLTGAQSAQAMVELVLALPIILSLAVGLVTLSRIVQAQTSITMVAHESARAGSLAVEPREAERRVLERAQQVAANLRLRDADLIVDADTSRFGRTDGRVRVRAAYRLDLSPAPALVLNAEHVEWVDPFRSGVASR